MCGVFAEVGPGASRGSVEKALRALAHRGPDASGVAGIESGWVAHVRLAIVDLDARSDQPMRRGETTLSYNGELWNFRELRAELESLGRFFETAGDTEVVATALDEWDEAALPRMNGMFALAWARSGRPGVRLARDRFGEVPLHVAPLEGGGWAASSELKAFSAAQARLSRWVGPGEVVELPPIGAPSVRRWYEPPIAPRPLDAFEAADEVRALLGRGVRERSMSDVPVCVLLSGGVDSSAIAALLSRIVPELVAFTAVLDEKSPDLRAAREVASALGLRLIEVRVPPPTADDLASVVRLIELPHKAQVEIAWACVKLADAMAGEGFKVTFSGEGSDELWGAYNFVRNLVAEKGWHRARRDLFLTQARKNFPRCNKVFMSRSIECRLPFLSPGLVESALSLPQSAVQDGDTPAGRKRVMARAFESLLPEGIARRPRVAFQAALGLREVAEKAVADPVRFYRGVFMEKYGARAI